MGLWSNFQGWLDRTSSDRLEADRCEDLRPHLVSWMAGTADKQVELRIRLHLSEGCAGCATELDALYRAFHAVPLASPPQDLGEQGAELLARKIAALPQNERQEPVVYPETDGRKLGTVLLVLFAIALVVAALWGRQQGRDLDQALSRVAFEESRTRQVSGDYQDLRQRAGRVEAHLDALTDPAVTSHDVPAGPNGARLRAFVGLERGMLTLASTGLSEPEAGQTHRVWWLQGEVWTAVGELPGGRVRVTTLTLPEGAALPARLQVSTEAAGAPSDQPGGALVLAGELLPGQPWADPGAGEGDAP